MLWARKVDPAIGECVSQVVLIEALIVVQPSNPVVRGSDHITAMLAGLKPTSSMRSTTWLLHQLGYRSLGPVVGVPRIDPGGLRLDGRYTLPGPTWRPRL
jgi:hypothetical protein